MNSKLNPVAYLLTTTRNLTSPLDLGKGGFIHSVTVKYLHFCRSYQGVEESGDKKEVTGWQLKGR